MKTVFTFILLGMFSVFIANEAHSQVRFGVKGGIDVIDHKISSDMLRVSNRLGYQLGPTVEAMLPGSGFGAELSLLYGRKEYDVKEKEHDVDISNYDYISIPLSLKKRFGITSLFSVFVSAGVFADLKLSGGDIDIDDYIEEYKSKNFAAGVNAGAGVRVLSHFDLGLYYRATLTDKYSIDNPDFSKLNKKKFQSWSVGLTYFF